MIEKVIHIGSFPLYLTNKMCIYSYYNILLGHPSEVEPFIQSLLNKSCNEVISKLNLSKEEIIEKMETINKESEFNVQIDPEKITSIVTNNQFNSSAFQVNFVYYFMTPTSKGRPFIIAERFNGWLVGIDNFPIDKIYSSQRIAKFLHITIRMYNTEARKHNATVKKIEGTWYCIFPTEADAQKMVESLEPRRLLLKLSGEY